MTTPLEATQTRTVIVTSLVPGNPTAETNYVQLNPDYVEETHVPGRIHFDATAHTAEIDTDIDGVALAINQEQVFYARNSTGATIPNGTPVMYAGVTGQTVLITRDDGTGRIAGVTTHDIPNNTVGLVTETGRVNKVDTSAFADGVIVYSTTGGVITTTRTPSIVGAILYSHATNGIIGAKVQQVPSSDSGWAHYADSQYTSASPLALSSNTDTRLPNDALGSLTNESQMPLDIATMYDADNQVITGRNGDGITITIELKAVPLASGGYAEIWLDIGGAVGELYRRPFTFPKGSGVERTITFSTTGYTLDTWEANGAQVWVNSSVATNVYDIRYILTRTHKAR